MSKSQVLAVVTVWGALASGCAVKTVASKVLAPFKKATIELVCTPNIGMGSAFGPVHFTASLRVRNPGEKYWCPAVEWYVDGSRVSSHEGDCDPYDAVGTKEGKEPETWSEPIRHFYLFGGDHVINAKLSRAGRLLASKSCAVTAR